jgi:hypothetical protein
MQISAGFVLIVHDCEYEKLLSMVRDMFVCTWQTSRADECIES